MSRIILADLSNKAQIGAPVFLSSVEIVCRSAFRVGQPDLLTVL